jgi:hypothetical protein
MYEFESRKPNVLKLLLEEATKRNLKWLVQQSGEVLYPDQVNPYDEKKWKFTDKIEETIKYVEDIGNMAHIVFSDYCWAYYIKHYSDNSIEDLSDYLVTPWLDKFSDRLDTIFDY